MTISISVVYFCYNFIYFLCDGFSLVLGILSTYGARGCGFSCGAQALGLSGCRSCGSESLEHRLNSSGVWA